VEGSALTPARTAPGLRGPSPLLRLQTDERLIALTRRGQHAAFEVLCSRYQARLLSFVRHMVGSREDAEDVLQEVFAAAFNAVLGDEREINVRPWLYRIARNRALNHLRRATAVGVDSMDVHFADHGISTGDRVLRRESFRELLADVRQLPETQRTALLLREIDALSYEQIAQAMDTTVPSVKSLLVRARISLAEAAEARKLNCEEVRLELGEVAEGLVKLSPPARRHVRDCDRCRSFKRQLRENNHALAAILPVGPVLLLKNLLAAKLGTTASASSAHVASGAGATVGAGAVAGAGAVSGAGAGGVFTVGAGALASKAVAGLAAAAIVSAGAVAANQPSHHRHHAAAAKTAYVAPESSSYEPVVVSERAQPLSVGVDRPATVASQHAARHRLVPVKPSPAAIKPATTPIPSSAAATPIVPTVPATPAKPAAPPGSTTPTTQLTTETTQLPASATGAPPAPPTGQPTTTPGASPAASAPPATGAAPSAQQAPGTVSAGAGVPASTSPGAPTASAVAPASANAAPATTALPAPALPHHALRRTRSSTRAPARHHAPAATHTPARHLTASRRHAAGPALSGKSADARKHAPGA
jgi:RNA polymerase sigma factor (sigma-70 family)